MHKTSRASKRELHIKPPRSHGLRGNEEVWSEWLIYIFYENKMTFCSDAIYN